MFLLNFFKSIANSIAKLFKRIDKEKAKKILSQIHNLYKEAIPIVQLVASLTPSPTDDVIVASLINLGWTAESIINQVDEVKKDGQRLALATEALKEHLLKIIKAGGKVDIGDEVLSTVEDVLALDKNILRSAIQSGYTIWKLAAKSQGK